MVLVVEFDEMCVFLCGFGEDYVVIGDDVCRYVVDMGKVCY